MARDIKQLISQMTLEEKAGMCSGLDFWHLKGVERLGIPSIMVTDGPHGLRKQAQSADHLGLHDSVPATCFPSAAGIASSWDRDLIEKMGQALGEECQAEDVAVLLGPGANIKRSPLCGRNFEYFSEDPYLSSQLAASHIRGVQSQGVGTSLKHFAVNNQEHRRMSVDAVVDERTLREIYLASFEGAVKEAQPWTVMCSYNQVNGEYASENEMLLTDILKKQWGHEGFVVSDWGAVNERAEGLKAGLELEMPSSSGVGDAKIVEAVRSGELEEEVLDRAVERVLNVIFLAVDNKKENAAYDQNEHHELARVVARESMVLLKNEDAILPLQKDSRIAVIGQFAQKPRYQGGGSSHIKPTRLDHIYDELVRAAGASASVTYAAGYDLNKDEATSESLQEAADLAAAADTAVLFLGLPDNYESEGYDRTHLRLPDSQLKLLEAVTAVQSHVVVVLSNGSAVEMPWLGDVKGVLEAYLGGQALGGAIADLLFGVVSPSGKLAETFPQKLAHTPAHLNFPGEMDRVEYKEGLFVGYRYYDAKEIEPLFPFGYGLSYTEFEYSNLQVDRKQLNDSDKLKVSVTVTNTGSVTGKEIVQIYVNDVQSTVIRPQKELKGFAKVELQPGESRTVEVTLDRRAFAYYDTDLQEWHVESGEFFILVGKSSKEIVLSKSVTVNAPAKPERPVTRNSLVGDLLHEGRLSEEKRKHVMDYVQSSMGLFSASEDDEDGNPEMMEAMMRYMPLRAVIAFAPDSEGEKKLQSLISTLNS
ncbi:glycoside hydrolase family 3 C-terminal domain-containing protein [Paenibacillus sp. JX-17]|uniref:Glycoside hydrolase family 3 C-terminal domain-containing protein n=1 Tax=Paenibacillus lacisoli TaxID=3064525 RepID=A0ABT9C8H4_9BACL|nr:glycoside hydrolase family 3 C-terminal domain-containing protein [Paenibacillus sp. JX-17]MDO7905521.1 glycoside hydrolase family 3 C-terminal domain-containing protein [Paenibacillus sp. JX-17]